MKLPAPNDMPKKVPRPRRAKKGRGTKARDTKADVLRKRAELRKLLMTPSMEEEYLAPPKLKVKMWKHEPKEKEYFVGREHTLVGTWPIDDPQQVRKYWAAFRKYKQTGYEVGVAQWKGKAYLYAKPTKRSGMEGEFVRQRLPSKQSFRPKRTFPIPFSRREGGYKRVAFYNTVGQLEGVQNDLRLRGFATKAFRFSKGRKAGKTAIGYVLYARHIREPKRIPVVGGGERGTMSSRQYRRIQKHYREGGIEAGDKMERYVGGKKVTLYRTKDLTYDYRKVAKEYDRLKQQGYAVVFKSYTSAIGVEYHALFVSKDKTKERAKDYRKLQKEKRDIKLVPASPRWPMKKSPDYVTPRKPHPKAVLVLEAGATEFEGQQAIISRQQTLKKQGVETEVVFGTDVTHLYAVPSEGQESVVIPRRASRRGKEKKPPKLVGIWATEPIWESRGVDIRRIERQRTSERLAKMRQRTSIVSVPAKRRAKKK